MGFFNGTTIPGWKGHKLSMYVFVNALQVINRDHKSALYLAIEMGYYKFVNWILGNYFSVEDNKS